MVAVAFNALCEIHALSSELLAGLKEWQRVVRTGDADAAFDHIIKEFLKLGSTLHIYEQYIQSEATLVNLLAQQVSSGPPSPRSPAFTCQPRDRTPSPFLSCLASYSLLLSSFCIYLPLDLLDCFSQLLSPSHSLGLTLVFVVPRAG